MQLISTLAKVQRQDAGGDRIPWLFPAVVSDIADPLNLRRIKVKLPSRDGDAESDWLLCCRMSNLIDTPMPVPDRDFAICGYLDGDVAQGFWLGVLINQVTMPPFSWNITEDFNLQVSGKVRLMAEGEISVRTQGEVLISSEVSESSILMRSTGEMIIRSNGLDIDVRDLAAE